MFSIVGIVVVIGSVLGGFLMEKGKLPVLIQPAEFLTIAGAALGTVLAANPMHVLKGVVGGVLGVLKGGGVPEKRYVESLKMLFDLFTKARKEGLVAIEADIEEPSKSQLFSKYPAFLKDHHVSDFVCDTMRMAVTGGVKPFDVDQMMELDLEVHHHTSMQPTQALSSMADALPGLGIVAAVLGIVVTMGALGGPPAEIGHKVAAALVGTFSGHSALLRGHWTDCSQYDQERGRTARLLPRAAGDAHGLHQGHNTHSRRGNGPASHSGTRASQIRHGRKGLPRQRRGRRTRSQLRSDSMPEPQEPIIIIKRKKAAHGAHHGGAWKVAYADFVTAMMSLFIVLWLISSNDAVKQSVAAYFKDPKGTAKLQGSMHQGSGHALPLHKEDMANLKQRLQDAAMHLPHFDQLGKQIDINAAPEGLEIELLEDGGGTFFELGSAKPKPALNQFLTLVSKELGKVPNKISIEGHTDSLPYNAGGDYTNWELSADRANAARRLMQTSGIAADQVAEVRGFADQQLRMPERPTDPSNRRITLIVHADAAEPAHGVSDPKGKESGGSSVEEAEAQPKAAPGSPEGH